MAKTNLTKLIMDKANLIKLIMDKTNLTKSIMDKTNLIKLIMDKTNLTKLIMDKTNLTKLIMDKTTQLCLSSTDNECKCQILLLIYPYTLRHYHLINIYIYTELAPKLSATASVAQW